ncbi:efflux RND transporter periplasmic adaptor subunit [Photobacterium nomapromontoriensis]|uniref:efflux RND transporter periplasmic adaptor subunit n=1 Tax=Photobacterium nomapromontoriensis TaxID=2910237 RepID=UPI003D0C8DA6
MSNVVIPCFPRTRMAAIVLLGGLLAGCNQANSEPHQAIVKPVKLYEIPVLMDQYSDTFPARAEAFQHAKLSFQVPGEIEKVTVCVGQYIEEGQVLAQLDDRDYQLAYEAKLAEFELAKSQYLRAKQLYEKTLISTDQFDRNETHYKTTMANLALAHKDVEDTVLRAPFAGVVSLKFVNQHQFIGANQPVLNIQNVDRLDLIFSLPVSFVEQSDLTTLQQAMSWVVMDNYPTLPIPAQFKELSTQPDPDTNSYIAKVTIDRPSDRNLLSGMAGQVHFAKTLSTAATHLPEGSWVEKDSHGGTVWQFDPATGVVNALAVTLNDNGDVVDGLKQGMVIVTAGAKDLQPGQQVRAWQREGGI